MAARLAADLEGTSYRFVRALATGGMGEVFVVEHLGLGTLGVMKVLRLDVAEVRGASERLRAEARILTMLSHPNLVRVRDFGWTKSQRPFLVTEMLEGEPLGVRLKREQRLPLAEVVSRGIELLDGLAVVHDAAIVHRDIKPDNLFLARGESGESTLKILDFGIAKVLTAEADAAAGGMPRTQTGMLIGTPPYLAPEQATGDAIDGRTDLYAVGCVLFRAIAGRPPFVKPTPVDVLGAHIAERPAAPSRWSAADGSVDERHLLAGLDAIVLKALEKKRSDRFEGARQMRRALEALRLEAAPRKRELPRTTVRIEPPTVTEEPSSGGTLFQAPPPRVDQRRAATVEDAEPTVANVATVVPAGAAAAANDPLRWWRATSAILAIVVVALAAAVVLLLVGGRR